MSSYIWLNGAVLPGCEAHLSPWDQGILVGEGVFETLVARQGFVIAFQEHWIRLNHSCAALGLTSPSESECMAALHQVLTANEMLDARLRITITSGVGVLASDLSPQKQTMWITAAPLPVWPATENVCLSPWPVNERGALSGVKSISYGENVQSLRYAKARGCGEAIMLNTKDELCEGTGSNVFLVIDGTLVTPPLSSGCLAGVTRLLVLDACRRAGIPYHEKSTPSIWLDRCEEAFLTSSTRDVHPIGTLTGRQLNTVGVVTRKVQQAYFDGIEKMKIVK
ncbi:MAG: hypothetical protein RL015_784 [Verrucomicrobiota bacterium]|jgi:branched-chain amino acid aminotransferase